MKNGGRNDEQSEDPGFNSFETGPEGAISRVINLQDAVILKGDVLQSPNDGDGCKNARNPAVVGGSAEMKIQRHNDQRVQTIADPMLPIVVPIFLTQIGDRKSRDKMWQSNQHVIQNKKQPESDIGRNAKKAADTKGNPPNRREKKQIVVRIADPWISQIDVYVLCSHTHT